MALPGAAKKRDVGLLASIWKFRSGVAAVSVWSCDGALRRATAIARVAARALAQAVLVIGGCQILTGCSEKPVQIETPMAWTAEVSRETPIVTASLAPETVPKAHIGQAPQSSMRTKELEASQSPAVNPPRRKTVSLRKGGGYRKIGKRYQVAGVWYTPRHDEDYEETGMASWYGDRFHAKKTANGETYDMNALTAAHRTLPLPSLVRVTNVENGRSVVVRVNDRGPFKKGRIIDVSERVARELQFADKGVAKVHVKYMGPAPLDGDDTHERASLLARAR